MRRLAIALAAALLPMLSALPSHAHVDPELSDDRHITEADLERVANALASPARPLEHRLRDEQRDPSRTIAYMRLEPGNTVLDIGSGSGYLALIAAELVGETGRVDIHNTPGWIVQFPSMDPDRMARAITRPNVGFVTAPWNGIAAEPETYDAIVMGQVYHDIILEGADLEALNRKLYDMLKPGGMLVIEDHDANPDMPIGQQVQLHRIDQTTVMFQVESSGYDAIDVMTLESPHDDFRFNVFRPGIRGRTTRYILGFHKPG